MFKNAKLNIKKASFSKILGWSGKGKQALFCNAQLYIS